MAGPSTNSSTSDDDDDDDNKHSTTTRNLQFQVPKGCDVGDVVTFALNDQTIELEIPPGVDPGTTVLSIYVGVTATTTQDEKKKRATTSTTNDVAEKEQNVGGKKHDNHDDDDDYKIRVRLPISSSNHGANKPTFYDICTRLPPPSAFVDKQQAETHSSNGNNGEEENDEPTDGTHGMIWSCGYELARHIPSIHPLLFASTTSSDDAHERHIVNNSNKTGSEMRRRQTSVLELGSGSHGLVGLALFHFHNHGERQAQARKQPNIAITLTDCAAALPLLRHNCDRYKKGEAPKASSPTQTSTLDVQHLHWETNDEYAPSPSNKRPKLTKYDVIMGADLLYNTTLIPALVDTIGRHIHSDDNSTNTILLWAVRWRKPTEERKFFEAIQTRFGYQWTLWEEEDVKHSLDSSSSRSSSSLDWIQYGNPDCEASNRFLLHTFVTVQGRTALSLCHVGEDEASAMTQTEYDKWEQLQTQVYIGRRCADRTINGRVIK